MALLGLSSAAGVVLALVATSTYGPGVSTDSVHYLSAAESLSRGQGLIDFFGEPFVRWPPLYPAVLGLMRTVTGVDLLEIARVLNALLLGISIFMAGILIQRSVQDRSMALALSVAGTLATLFSPSLLSVAANVLADTAFIAAVLLFFLVAQAFLARPSGAFLGPPKVPGGEYGLRVSHTLGLVLTASSAALIRWDGVTLILTGAILSISAFRMQPRRAILRAAAYSVLASLPLFVWVLARNVVQYDTLFGTRRYYIDALVNLTTSLRRIANWILPHSLTDAIPIGIVVALPIAILLLINSRAAWRAFYRRLSAPQHLPWVVFTLTYLPLVWLTRQSADHVSLHDDRYQAPLYVPLVILSILVIEELIAPHRILRSNLLKSLLVSAMFLWLIYPLTLQTRFIRGSLDQGVVSYNVYNTDHYNNSSFVRKLRAFPLTEDDLIYSNYPAVVYFFTGHLSQESPRSPTGALRTQAFLLDRYSAWPASTQAYLAWFRFDPLGKDLYFGPGDLEAIAQLETLLDHPDGVFYRVTRRAASSSKCKLLLQGSSAPQKVHQGLSATGWSCGSRSAGSGWRTADGGRRKPCQVSLATCDLLLVTCYRGLAT